MEGIHDERFNFRPIFHLSTIPNPRSHPFSAISPLPPPPPLLLLSSIFSSPSSGCAPCKVVISGFACNYRGKKGLWMPIVFSLSRMSPSRWWNRTKHPWDMRFFLPFFSFFLNFFPLPLLLPSLPSFLPFMAGRLTVVRLYATSPPAFIAIDCVFDCHQFVLGAGPTPFTGRSRPFATFDVPVVSFLPNPRDRTDLFVSLCNRPSLPPPPPPSPFFSSFF